VWLIALCRLLAPCVIVPEVRSIYSTSNMPRNCINSSVAGYYICGEGTLKSRRRSFTPLIKKCNEHYFGCEVRDQDKNWDRHFCCVTCDKRLVEWAKGSRCIPFAIPMVWREPTDHVSDRYFYQTSITGVIARSKHTVQYAHLPSAIRPFTLQCGVTCAKASNKHDAERQWVKGWRCRSS
jgi:hypothetical protein